MSSVEIRDSRRLTGPSILWDRAGAGLEVYGTREDVDTLISVWRQQARRMLDAVGWTHEEIAIRAFPGGASLVISAPIDALYTACEVNEWAVEAAILEVEGRDKPSLEEGAVRFRRDITDEANPALIALRNAAADHGVAFLSDDDCASVGLGKHSVTFPAREIPDPNTIDWYRVSDVPVALVTGTNGKSTTVRLIASMARSAGLSEGFSSTDGIFVDGELVEKGDYSGPEGARAVLRHPGVEVAVLETARGGILRRGLPIPRADAALVTNVGEDHLGEYGVYDLDTLIDTKLVIHRAVCPAGLLVLNADDPGLRVRGDNLNVPVAWFSLDPDLPEMRRHVMEGRETAWLDGGRLIWSRGGRREDVIGIDDIPITLGGAARHNVANSLAAILVAGRLGLPVGVMADGLRGFLGTPEENPGRGNLFQLGGVTAIIDFAHNAHGFRSLFDMATAMPASRRLVLLGQAGDRTDSSILEQVAITWKAHPDRIIIKEMEVYLRGRQKGEIPTMIEAELRRLGAGDDVISRADCEMEAVREALEWSRPGDLLLLLVYAERKETFDLLRKLQESEWRPGEKLPA